MPRRSSIPLRQHLFQIRKELLSAEFGALVSLFLIGPEADLFHAQVRPRARRRERPCHDTLKPHRLPRTRQRFIRLDFQHFTIDGTPVAAKREAMLQGWLEIVFHQPFRDQVRLR